MVTSATRSTPSVPGSAIAAAFSAVSSAVPKAPGMAPASRMWRVRRRVSMPAMPATPWRRRKPSRSPSLRQLLRRRASSRTIDAPAERPDAPRRRRAVDAVVADVRVGEGDDLAGVGRVGDDLLVAGQHGVEHDLAGRDGRRRRRWPRPRTWCRRPAPAAPRGSSSLRLPVDDDRLAPQQRVAHPARAACGRRRACCGPGWPAGPGRRPTWRPGRSTHRLAGRPGLDRAAVAVGDARRWPPAATTAAPAPPRSAGRAR